MSAWTWADVREVVNWVLGVLAVIGLYVSFKSWRRKKPTYLIRSDNLFSGLASTLPHMKIGFPDYGLPSVDAVTATKIAFWNAGNETINSQDVVKSDPVRLQAKSGVVILSTNIIEQAGQFNNFACRLNTERTEATITFDYLDHNEGALIQVFHSGTTNDDIHVAGTIKGVRRIQRRVLVPPGMKKRVSRPGLLGLEEKTGGFR